jgi:hypothetical protein
MLTGLSRSQQILFFMENHQEGLYSTNYISQYICNNFDLSGKNPTEKGMLAQINCEVSSTFSKFIDPKYNSKQPINFQQHIGKNGSYLYSYKKNNNLNLPTPNSITLHNPYRTKKLLKPTQTTFDFQQEEETIIIETPLFEDIVAADKINDPIQMIFDIYNNIKINNIDNFNISTIRDNKKITIEISNI